MNGMREKIQKLTQKLMETTDLETATCILEKMNDIAKKYKLLVN